MKVLNPSNAEGFKQRLNTIDKDQKPLWGKMNAAQMFQHLSVSFGGALGELNVKQQDTLLFRTIGKWTVLYAPFPFPKNAPTAKEYRITSSAEFEACKKELFHYIDLMSSKSSDFNWSPHPLFGKINSTEWKRLAYLHIQHHLKQFDA